MAAVWSELCGFVRKSAIDCMMLLPAPQVILKSLKSKQRSLIQWYLISIDLDLRILHVPFAIFSAVELSVTSGVAG
jgi:hypothetical protein